jgi:hypothetical protein
MDLLLHYQQNSIVPVLCIKEKVSFYFFSLLEVMVSRDCSVLVYKFYACNFPITDLIGDPGISSSSFVLGYRQIGRLRTRESKKRFLN